MTSRLIKLEIEGMISGSATQPAPPTIPANPVGGGGSASWEEDDWLQPEKEGIDLFASKK